MKLFKFPLFLLLAIGLSNCLYGQTKWSSHYEDDTILIEYRIADCNDDINNLDFKYYFFRIENKLSKKVNLQYELGKTESTSPGENYVNLILNPREVQTGDCTSTTRHLKAFARDNKAVNATSIQPLLITKIKTYAL